MKRLMTLVVIAMLLVPGIVMARGGSEPAGPEKVTLTIAGRDGAYGDAMQLAADAYAAKNPNVSFEILKLGGGPLLEQTVVDLGSGTGTYDLIMIDDPNAPRMMQAGWLADLGAMYAARGESVDPDIIPNILKLGRFPYGDNGTLYALPHVGNVELFAYRRDLAEKYGYANAQTWTDVLAAAKAIAAGESDITPILFRGTKGNPIVTGFLPIYWAFGANLLVDGQPAFDSPEALNALNFFLELAKYAPEDVSVYQSAQVRDALYAGTGAIAIEVWPGWIGGLEDPEVSKVVGKVAVTTHPGQVNPSSPLVGVWLLGIPESSSHKDAAFDFLQFITSADMQRQIALETGIPPTRVSVHQDAELQAKYPWYPPELAGLQGGMARPRTDYWGEIETAFGGFLQQALIGDLTAEEALAQTQAKVEEIVQ